MARMAIQSSILTWRSQGQRTLAGYSPWGHKGSDKSNTSISITFNPRSVEPGSETIGRLSKKTQMLDLDTLFCKCVSSNVINLSSRRNSIPRLSKCKEKPIYVFPFG